MGQDGNWIRNDVYGEPLDDRDDYDLNVRLFYELSIMNIMLGLGKVVTPDGWDGRRIKIRIEVIDAPTICVVDKRANNTVDIKVFARTPEGQGKDCLYEKRVNLQTILDVDAKKTIALEGGQFILLAATSIFETILLERIGVIDQLTNTGDRGAGIHVLMKNGQLSYDIVRRMKRPDLPYLDTSSGKYIMSRPYKDEILIKQTLQQTSFDVLLIYADEGNPDSMEKVANAYLSGNGVDQDYSKAAFWFEKLAQTEDETGQFNIGLMYAKGCGVPINIKKAFFWIKKAAENGHTDACKAVESLVQLQGEFDKNRETNSKDKDDLEGCLLRLGLGKEFPRTDTKIMTTENKKEYGKETEEKSGDTIPSDTRRSLDDTPYMYVCHNCQKVFKVKGRNKKVKCNNCSKVLEDTGLTESIWKTYDKEKKRIILSGEDNTVPNFFIDIDTLNSILELELKDNYRDINLTVDIIDMPYYLVYTSDDDNRIAKAFKRLQMYSHNESGIQVGSATAKKADGNIEVRAIDDLSENMPVLYVACRRISQYIIDNDLQTVYMGFDPEEKGIMLTVENEKIAHRVVGGRQRPSMECYTLLGGVEMSRPYADEIFEADELEDISIEEKEKAANDGNVYAMKQVALAYLNGDDVDADPQKAASWMEKAAENNDIEAQYNTGLFYAKGHGVRRDFKKAAEWMNKALENGDPDAKAPAEQYAKMANSIAKANAGDAQAQADLSAGLMSLGGSLDQAGTGNDYIESVKWAEKSAAQGNGDGMWNLALAYEHGRGVKKDIKKAIELYQKGADIENAKCLHNLAICYLRGDVEGFPEGGKKGQEKAFGLLIKAAEQGYGLAMRDVGRCYQFATGTTGNMKKAVEWYEKACEVLDDPELKAKTEHFKMLADVDDNFDKDYPESGDDDETDSSNALDDAIFAVAELDIYEHELAADGMMPDVPTDDGKFIRVHKKAEEGDERALRLLKKLDNIGTEKTEASSEFLRKINSCNTNASRPEVDVDKEIKEKLKTIRNKKNEADKQFREGKEILRDPGITMDYDNFIDVSVRLFKMSDSFCRTLYNSLQNLVQELDAHCRKLLEYNPSSDIKKEIYELIKEMNENAEITNDFKINFNGSVFDNPGQKKFEPSIKTKDIERFWRGECDKSTQKTSSDMTTADSNPQRSSFFDAMNQRTATGSDEIEKEIMGVLREYKAGLSVTEVWKKLGEKYSNQKMAAKLNQLEREGKVTSRMEGRIKKFSIK